MISNFLQENIGTQYILPVYVIILIFVCAKIILDTNTPSKAIIYLALVILVPIVGMFVYFSIGMNYRKRKLYKKHLQINRISPEQFDEFTNHYSTGELDKCKKKISHFQSVTKMLSKFGSLSSANNHVELLINGEHKFPRLLEDLRQAKEHIHIQYYIFVYDKIGKEIFDILIERAQNGVKVRFIYDDFGSKTLTRRQLKLLTNAGIEVAPFFKINYLNFANSLNYRNHRKIVVIDRIIGYVGGINVEDKYINSPEYPHSLFWRDTHVRIHGMSVMNLQYVFLTDWNFCAKQNVKISEEYFDESNNAQYFGDSLVQMIRSGPDSSSPSIMYGYMKAIEMARREVLITTPYFIPEESFVDAIKMASLSGIDVKLLVPGISDSSLVNAAANSYYEDLMEHGVEIYKYMKGFVHAKTLVCDGQIAFVSTANLDQRSFDLNFEVASVIYDEKVAGQLREVFFADLDDADRLDLEIWKERSILYTLGDRSARLIGPLL